MDTISFEKLVLKTAFCCMASDGIIHPKEVKMIKLMCEKSTLFQDFNFQEEINFLINKINTRGKEFITYYFDLLGKSTLTEKEELTIIDFAIQTIKADDEIEYSEIKFFKNIRHRLKISDENILAVFPEIEQYLEEDIVTKSFLDRITKQYLEAADFPKFDLIGIDINSIDNSNESQP